GRSRAPHPGRPPGSPRSSPATSQHPNPPLPGLPERTHLMITDELEHELRRTFALADAQITVPGQARQRLLPRDYHPPRGHQPLAAGITAAAAAALALGLGLSGAIGSAPAHRTGTIQTAAFTLVQNANGTATLTINPTVLFEPTTLQRDLERDHIP